MIFSRKFKNGSDIPNSIVFNTQSSVARSSLITSNTVTITGISSVPITITNGEYSINGGTYTSVAGVISLNQTLTVRHTSSNNYSIDTITTVHIGGLTTTFTSTTLAANYNPISFTNAFIDVLNNFSPPVGTGAEVSRVAGYNSSTTNYNYVDSNNITISGLSPDITIPVYFDTWTGSGYTTCYISFNNGSTWLSTSPQYITIPAGGSFTVKLRLSASSDYSYDYSTGIMSSTLTVGDKSDTFTVQTRSFDAVPNAFSFTNVTNAALSSWIESNNITISGFDLYGQGDDITIWWSNPNTEVSFNNGTTWIGTTSTGGYQWTKPIGAYNYDTGSFPLKVRILSSSLDYTNTSTIITIGATGGGGTQVSSTFTVTTVPDLTPIDFNFTNVNNQSTSSPITSSPVHITGLSKNYLMTITATGGMVAAITSGSTFTTFDSSVNVTTSSTGTIEVEARVTTGAASNTPYSVSVTVGTVTKTFTATTSNIDSTVDSFPDFTSVTGSELNVNYTSNSSTATGLTPFSFIDVTFGSHYAGSTVQVIGNTSGTYSPSTFNVQVSNAGTITFQINSRSASTFSTIMNYISVGGWTNYYNITTRSIKHPGSQNITESLRNLNTTYESSVITISGAESNYNIPLTHFVIGSITNTQYRYSDVSAADLASKGYISFTNNTPLIINSSDGIFYLQYKYTTPSGYKDEGNSNGDIRLFPDIGLYQAYLVLNVSNKYTWSNMTQSGALSYTNQPLNTAIISQTTITISGLVPNLIYYVQGLTGVSLIISTDVTTINEVTVDSVGWSTNQLSITPPNGTFYLRWKFTTPNAYNAYSEIGMTLYHSFGDSTTQGLGTCTTMGNTDGVPDSFSFFDGNLAQYNTLYYSNTVKLTNMTSNYNISLSCTTANGAQLATSLNNDITPASSWVTSKTTPTNSNGELYVALRLTTGNSPLTAYSTTLTAGGITDTFTITTADLTPGPFDFGSDYTRYGETPLTDNSRTISGMSANVSVPISYSASGSHNGFVIYINGTGYNNGSGMPASVTTNASGQITARISITGAFAYGVSGTVTLTVGGVSGSYTVTTYAADTIPDPQTFATVVGYPSVATANTGFFTIIGLEPQYSIPWSTSGSINGVPTSIGSFYVNGISYTAGSSGNVTTDVNGQISNCKIVVAAATVYDTTRTATLTVGSGSFSISCRTYDVYPNAFSFTNKTNISLNTNSSSTPITISGMESNYNVGFSAVLANANSSLTIGGVTYSGSASLYPSGTASTDLNGQLTGVYFTNRSSSSFLTAVTSTLTVGTDGGGGVSASFSVTTRAVDLDPDPFDFGLPVTVSVSFGNQESPHVLITGMDPLQNVTVTTNGVGNWWQGTNNFCTPTSTTGVLTTNESGQLVDIYVRVAPTAGVTRVATLTINNNVSGSYSLTGV